MQQNNSKFHYYFGILGGATMTAGHSLNLAKGQVGLFPESSKLATKDGLPAITSLAGRSKDEKFVMRVGRANYLPATRSTSNKSLSTVPFAIKDVLAVGVDAPKVTEQVVDEVILGYNGIDVSTAIKLKRKDRKKITLELSGELIGMYGYPDNKVVTTVYLDPKKAYGTEDCDTLDNCEELNPREYVLEAIETLRRFQLRGGVTLDNVVEITPVEESTGGSAVVTTNKYFQTIAVKDGGDQSALAMIQAAYPTNKLTRISYTDITSVYQTVTDTNSALSNYVVANADVLKTCEDCAAGYTALSSGYVYNVKIADAGSDVTTTVDNLPGYVAGTVHKIGQNGSIGVYTIVLDDQLTQAEITTFLATNATTATAEIELRGEVVALCQASGSESYTWTVGDACQVSTQNYTITLADTNCGQTRLAELQAAYPDATVTIAQEDTANSRRTITLTGSSGTANINIGGTNYLATFATSLTTTAANFVSTNGAAITAATGGVVTAANGVITYTDATTGFPAITVANASGNLAATLGAVTVVQQSVQGGCQTKYQAAVVTNMVCDECDPIFKDFFVSQAPRPYEANEWTLVEGTAPTTSLMGIRFKGKKLQIRTNEYLRDKLAFTESSVKIRVTGGQLDEVRAGIGELTDDEFAVDYKSHWQPLTHLGGSFQWLVDRDYQHFTGEQRHQSALTRVLFTDEESTIDQSKQYVDYSITVKNTASAGNPAGHLPHTEYISYHFLAEVGRHSAVENLLNEIAGAAGVQGVAAFAD